MHSVIPIIQINSTFTHDNSGNVLQAEKFKGGIQVASIDFNQFVSNSLMQVRYTHKYVKKILWEIGNEDYYMYDPKQYINILNGICENILSEFPDDKIIVNIPNIYFGDRNKRRWFDNFIRILQNQNAFVDFNYLDPHFYDKPYDDNSLEEIMDKIRSPRVMEFLETMKNVTNNKQFKYFITEFSLFLNSYNKYYNTQIHALGMLSYLIQFNSSASIIGIIHHGFTQKGSALFFDKSIVNDFKYLDTLKNNQELFSYYPPQATALKLFFDYIHNKFVDYLNIDGIHIGVIENNKNKLSLCVLNTNSVDYSNLISDLNSNLSQKINSYKTVNITSFLFNDLNSHFWSPYENKITKSFLPNENLKIYKYSFNIIEITKN